MFSVFISAARYQEELVDNAIQEKKAIAFIINETFFHPQLRARVDFPQPLEITFLEEMTKFKDVVYLRVVNLDGGIYRSSIEEDTGRVIEDPNRLSDVKDAIFTKRTLVRDEIYQGKDIKLMIYSGYEDRTIWIAFSLENINKTIRAMIIQNALIGLVPLAIVILVIFFILRSIIIAPLKKITLACEEIRKGNLDVKIDVKSKTEIGELVDTFNRMLKDLRRFKSTLEKSKEILEIEVKERTKELKMLTETLEDKIKQRTKQLQERIEELEKFHKLTVGRELKMIELKKEIQEFKKELKQP